MLNEALLQEVVRRVLEIAQPERIILFGSAASGGWKSESDIDLLVLEKAPPDKRKESVRIRSALRGLGYAFDVIVISTEWFEASKNIIGGIAYPAHKYGKVIYESTEGR